MKTNLQTFKRLGFRAIIVACLAAPAVAFAQQPAMQFFRDPGKAGLNVFETNKTDTVPFTGLKVRIGGAFAQDWQSLTDHNYVPTNVAVPKADSANRLLPLGGGFNLAMANLTIDGQLADGVRTNITVYLSTRHHEDSWVKNGYLQMDKMLFFNSDFINNLMNYLTIDVGDLEVDYGDAHYRRSDGGNDMHNPFIENNIMDEFATEIGGEVYFHDPSGILAMVGVTDGALNPTVKQSSVYDSTTGQIIQYDPAFLAKFGYDKQINSDLRIRLTGSYYEVKNAGSNTLFGGDRSGSRYFLVMDNSSAPVSSGDADETFTDGRFNPGFSNEVSTFMINPFIKFGGLEFFGTYESANGRKSTETTTRNATQLAGDLIYRFGANENFWIGVRYNTVKAQLAPEQASIPDITIDRIAGYIGWFLTDNVMMKGEYVDQTYKNFPTGNILNGGEFKGPMIEAAIGF